MNTLNLNLIQTKNTYQTNPELLIQITNPQSILTLNILDDTIINRYNQMKSKLKLIK